ncbi:MAG: hypothetical protein ACRCTA_05565, partial [Bacilli bacterium]
MKKLKYVFMLVILALLISSPVIIDGYKLELDWVKTFGGSHFDEFYDSKILSDGNIISVGATRSILSGNTSSGEYDGIIVKTDSLGNLLWQKQLGTIERERYHDVIEDQDGNIVVVGTLTYISPTPPPGKSREMIMTKLDPDGNILFNINFGDSLLATDLIETSDHGYLAIGWDTGTLPGQTSLGGSDGAIVKVSKTGTIEWSRQFGGLSIDQYTDGFMYDNGNILLVGSSRSSFAGNVNGGGYDTFYTLIDSNGNLIWNKVFGGTGNDYIETITQTSDGGYIVGGKTNGVIANQPVFGKFDYLLIKYDALHQVEWVQVDGTSLDDYVTSSVATFDDYILVLGMSNQNLLGIESIGGNDGYTIKIDNSGDIIEYDVFGTENNEEFLSVVTDSIGNYLVSGYTTGEFESTTQMGRSDAVLLTLYDEYILSYDFNSGTGNIEDQEFRDNSVINVSSEACIKPNYQFLGWATSLENA